MKAKTRNLKSTAAAFSVMVFGLTGVFLLSGFVEKNRPAPPAGLEDEDSALQGARLKGFSLGFESLTADWYWARALQYIGAKVVRDRNANAIFNLENLNNLNPRQLIRCSTTPQL